MLASLRSATVLRAAASRRFIHVGQQIPDVKLKVVQNGEVKEIQTSELFANKKAVLVGYPGCFTPTCQNEHLPGYIKNADQIKSKGVKDIYALSVNDPFIAKAFAESLKDGSKITLIADGNGEFTKQLQASIDLSAAYLSTRTKRFSAIVENGRVVVLNDEEGPKMSEKSKVDTVLKQL
eukprot:GILI01011652.1.p1 GENE.GILI01011652.1~~GILI01011652.1.p1  ORF type:complete len:179 (+),score=83.20 GILI01011652.1:69-605(+)